MTESSTTSDIGLLLQEGNAALLAGDTYEARQSFRRANELDPENVEAWKGLAGSVRPYREKRDYLERALQVDPENTEIQSILSYVDSKIAAGEVLAPRGVSVREEGSLLSKPPEPDPSDEPDHVHLPVEDENAAGLRCISCGTLIDDTSDVVWSPVGQLCPDCARARRPRNYQVSSGNVLVAVPVTLFVSIVVSFLFVAFLGGWFLLAFLAAFLLAPIVAEFNIRMLDYLTKAKRGRPMQIAVGVSIAVGAAPMLLLTLSLSLLLFTVLMITTSVARLR